MRRIALLVGTLGGGGAERVAATLANAWAACGVEVIIIPTYLGDTTAAYPRHRAVQVVLLRDCLPQVRGLPAPVAKLKALRLLVARTAPDVVIAFLTNVNITAVIALRGLGIPIVLSERVDPAASIEMSWLMRAARRVLYQFADTLVVQTPAAARRYAALLLSPPRLATIPNPLPLALVEETRRSTVRARGGEIVAMGRLTPQKQFDRLITAFATAFTDDADWTLTIWGEGHLRDDLQRLAEGLGVGERVRLAGMTVDPWTVLATAQMFVLSSAYEGFPNAMLEAMALALPCIAFDCPSGPRELALDGEVAVLVTNGDVEELARAMRLLASAPERRSALGRIAAASVRDRFAEQTVLGAWDRLLDEVARQSRFPGSVRE